MTSNRMVAAVLFVAASIPVMATTTPWRVEPDCADAAAAASPFADTSPSPFAPSFRAADPQAAHSLRLAPDEAPHVQLAAFALTLQDIRYRRGGSAPKTGFDCSGFVSYVYAHTLGIDLARDAAGQYRAGVRVARDELRAGDLVFFRIGERRVSHVGLYLGDGRFIHAPSPGKRVRVDELHDPYWAHRFVGARRPAVLT